MIKKKSSAVYEILLSRLADLPTLPDIVYELNRQFRDKQPKADEIAKLISFDPSLTMQVFKLANVPAITSKQGPQILLTQAIQTVGPEVIKDMLLSTSIIMINSPFEGSGFNIEAFWRHCIGAGVAAEAIAVWVGEKRVQQCFLAGLLHDIGKTVLYTIDRQDFLHTSQFACANGMTLDEAETHISMASHAFWGYMIAKKWRLPIEIQQAILFHHEHREAHRQGIAPENHRIVDIVFLANLLIHAMKFGHSGHNKIIGAKRELLNRLPVTDEDLRGLVDVINRNLNRASNILRIIQSGAA